MKILTVLATCHHFFHAQVHIQVGRSWDCSASPEFQQTALALRDVQLRQLLYHLTQGVNYGTEHPMAEQLRSNRTLQRILEYFTRLYSKLQATSTLCLLLPGLKTQKFLWKSESTNSESLCHHGNRQKYLKKETCMLLVIFLPSSWLEVVTVMGIQPWSFTYQCYIFSTLILPLHLESAPSRTPETDSTLTKPTDRLNLFQTAHNWRYTEN